MTLKNGFYNNTEDGKKEDDLTIPKSKRGQMEKWLCTDVFLGDFIEFFGPVDQSSGRYDICHI